jgi:hypothetical protein
LEVKRNCEPTSQKARLKGTANRKFKEGFETNKKKRRYVIPFTQNRTMKPQV